ncbi:MAG: hypothetical protein HON53_20850 [Planctomycetaceae bacterium]|jgi:hypothetical protein|nr:hypothetical protein [Planctomycetaceae bacterium]MBT6496358.1 hypothetical protein [Planctomycetaceae bacterium]
MNQVARRRQRHGAPVAEDRYFGVDAQKTLHRCDEVVWVEDSFGGVFPLIVRLADDLAHPMPSQPSQAASLSDGR